MNKSKIGMKSLIGLSVLTVGLAACSPSVDGWQISAAEKACAKRGGIDHMQTFIGITATCRDGTFIKPKRGG